MSIDYYKCTCFTNSLNNEKIETDRETVRKRELAIFTFIDSSQGYSVSDVIAKVYMY